MKVINECIGDIGRANSSIFTTLDLTSGFWQMKLEPESQPLTAFTIPSRGQFHWITSPMGLLGCPASFQRLMEQVLRGLQNILIYIDNVLIHTDTHEKHLEALEQVLMRLHQHHLKINLDKCLLDKQVSYLGFTLTPDGIKPGDQTCNTTRRHQGDSVLRGTVQFLPEPYSRLRDHSGTIVQIDTTGFRISIRTSAQDSTTGFPTAPDQLSQQPALAFPRSDQSYLLITNAYTPNTNLPGGLCATLALKDEQNQIKIISHASRQLKEKKITHHSYSRWLPLPGAWTTSMST
jgi:hypothetical protein